MPPPNPSLEPRYKPVSRLSWRTALFPLSMVLFEFATYIANDMILPAMPDVVREFGVGEAYIPTGMSAYIAGGAALQWLLGPLSDKAGRRSVMLWGVAFFVAASLAMFGVNSIVPFIVLRFIQGAGLCFVVAVGYAAVQEAFTDSTALKVTALMANVALISPLIGPLAGALLIQFAHWRWIFAVIAFLAALSLLGLWKTMPETVTPGRGSLRIMHVWGNYRTVFLNPGFRWGVTALSFSAMPLMAWIGQSPVILMEREGFSALEFGLWQIPVFAALIAGNLLLSHFADKVTPTRLIQRGSIPLFGGLVLGLGVFASGLNWGWLIFAMSVYAFGMGAVHAVIYRLTLYSSDVSKGTVSAALGMVMFLLFAFGIEAVKFGYERFGNAWFASACFLGGLVYLLMTNGFLRWRKTAALSD